MVTFILSPVRFLQCLLLTCLAFALPGSGLSATGTKLTLGAHTDFPLSLGGRLGVELPSRFRLASSLGVLPAGYINAINSVMVTSDIYSQSTADLIHSTLKSSLVWRLHAGFRPWENYGFHFEAGYGLITLGGGATAAEIISGTTGVALSDGAGSGKTFSVNSTLHMVNMELGWEWTWHHVYFRAALGGAFTLDSSTAVTANYKPVFPRITEAFAASTENYLNDTYRRYVHTPTVSLTAGYSFF